MGNSSFVVLCLLAPFCGGLVAQSLQVAGTTMRIATATVTRGLLQGNAGEMMQRFDASELTGFGIEDAYPGFQVVRGAVLSLYPYFGSVDVIVYGEDPAAPNYPDIQNPLATAIGVPAQFLTFSVAPFDPPALVPIGRDVFLSVRVGASGSPTSGMMVSFLSTTSSTYNDLPGAGWPASPPEAHSYLAFRMGTSSTVTYWGKGQFMIDLLTTTPTGMPTTVTHQSTQPPAQNAPGGTSMLSGLHPDAAAPPANVGRADDVGFIYRDFDLPSGSLVAFMASFNGFGPFVSLSQLLPGSTGVICLDLGDAFVTTVTTLDAGHYAWYTITLDPSVRTWLPQFWAQQAYGFDASANLFRASQCGRQSFR